MSNYGESAVWREARRAYDEDRVEASLLLLDSLGAAFGGRGLGFYRLVQAEAAARALGSREELAPGLSAEPAEMASDAIRDAFADVTARFGHPNSPVLVTFLGEEADAPWHNARYGYYTRKTDLDKVCIPSGLIHREEELGATLKHELGHVVVQNLTAGRAPAWLHEGIAQLAEGRHPNQSRGRHWTPTKLNAAFESDRREEGGWSRVGEAYEAALRIVFHLHQEKADTGLRALLEAFTDNGVLTEALILVGRDASAEAVSQVYGLSLEALFEDA